MPSCSSEMPSSRSEQIIPRDSTPRILLRRSLRNSRVCGSRSCAPTCANAIVCPAARLGAPQTTVCGSASP